MRDTEALLLIIGELKKAEQKHPGWVDDPIHAAGIVCEEAGESMQAALDMRYSNGTAEHFKTELAHTGAMAIRALMHL